AGTVNKGIGFPTIVEKIKVGTAYQYKVKNSKGATFYITASDKYVELKNK
ncbi:TPA: N-acetylmuramoyl-L-alanine amidase, partial [Listeria monocytogenes]|nr:N-acetylmuramoyl-L-alanine amidase [Listeria monocytogenes]